MNMNQRKCQRNPFFKRVKERTVRDAMESVRYWRELFEDGLYDQEGNKQKLTLQQAAEKVGIPKKTLEDYQQLFKKVVQIEPIEQILDQKMGYVRNLIKERNFKQHQMEIEQEEEEEEEQYTNCHALPAAYPCDDWQDMLNFNDQNYLNNSFEYDDMQNDQQVYSVPAITMQINNTKLKLEDPWEQESLGSEYDTDDEE